VCGIVTNLPSVSVVCCAHNEEKYVDVFMPNLLAALKGFVCEVIFVADRCKDKTVEKAKRYKINIIEKSDKKWKNSYAEALQLGYLNAKNLCLSIIDVDIVVPPDFFAKMLPKLNGDTVSVAANVITFPDTFWNLMIYAWEKTYNIAPWGRKPYGAARVIQKKALDEINGFRDSPTPDTDIDLRLAQKRYKSVASAEVNVYHIRHISIKTMINGQLNSGRGRYALGIDFKRTMAHAIFRLRPLVVCGWLLERQRSLHSSSKG
jgi:glycosyltransferase involved in cell wall biosynthesis